MPHDDSPLPRFALMSDYVGDIIVRPYPRCVIAEAHVKAPTPILFEPVTAASLTQDPFEVARARRPLCVEGVRINADGTMEVDASDVLSILPLLDAAPLDASPLPPQAALKDAPLRVTELESPRADAIASQAVFRPAADSLASVKARHTPAFAMALSAAFVIIGTMVWFGLGRQASAEPTAQH